MSFRPIPKSQAKLPEPRAPRTNYSDIYDAVEEKLTAVGNYLAWEFEDAADAKRANSTVTSTLGRRFGDAFETRLEGNRLFVVMVDELPSEDEDEESDAE